MVSNFVVVLAYGVLLSREHPVYLAFDRATKTHSLCKPSNLDRPRVIFSLMLELVFIFVRSSSRPLAVLAFSVGRIAHERAVLGQFHTNKPTIVFTRKISNNAIVRIPENPLKYLQICHTLKQTMNPPSSCLTWAVVMLNPAHQIGFFLPPHILEISFAVEMKQFARAEGTYSRPRNAKHLKTRSCFLFLPLRF